MTKIAAMTSADETLQGLSAILKPEQRAVPSGADSATCEKYSHVTFAIPSAELATTVAEINELISYKERVAAIRSARSAKTATIKA